MHRLRELVTVARRGSAWRAWGRTSGSTWRAGRSAWSATCGVHAGDRRATKVQRHTKSVTDLLESIHDLVNKVILATLTLVLLLSTLRVTIRRRGTIGTSVVRRRSTSVISRSGVVRTLTLGRRCLFLLVVRSTERGVRNLLGCLKDKGTDPLTVGLL
jgi:hypothetical protein